MKVDIENRRQYAEILPPLETVDGQRCMSPVAQGELAHFQHFAIKMANNDPHNKVAFLFHMPTTFQSNCVTGHG